MEIHQPLTSTANLVCGAIGRALRGDRCLCHGCGEYFNSSAAFDKHRIGQYDSTRPGYGRRCRTPKEMCAAGMAQTGAGFWLRGNPWTSAVDLPVPRRRRDRDEVVGSAGVGP
jgi:hypothetical protein